MTAGVSNIEQGISNVEVRSTNIERRLFDLRPSTSLNAERSTLNAEC